MLLKRITRADYDQLSFFFAGLQTYRAFARLDRNRQPKEKRMALYMGINYQLQLVAFGMARQRIVIALN